MKTTLLLTLLLFCPLAHSKLFLDVSLLYKKGVDKDLVLTNEVQSKVIADDKNWSTVKMKNSFSVMTRGQFMKVLSAEGPSDLVQLQVKLLKNGEVVQEFKGEQMQARLGWPTRASYTDQKFGQMIEITITPQIQE